MILSEAMDQLRNERQSPLNKIQVKDIDLGGGNKETEITQESKRNGQRSPVNKGFLKKKKINKLIDFE